MTHSLALRHRRNNLRPSTAARFGFANRARWLLPAVAVVFGCSVLTADIRGQDPGFAEWFGGNLGAEGLDVVPVPGGGGDFYVCGSTETYAPGHVFGPGTTNEITFPATQPYSRRDSFLARYTPDGVPVWVRMQSGGRIDVGRRITAFPDGSVLLIGDYDGFVSGLPAAGVTLDGGANPDRSLPARFSGGSMLAKYTADGDLLWARSAFAGEGYQWVRAAVPLDDGSLILVGYFRGATFGDADDPTPIPMPLGASFGVRSSDGFIAKYSATGDAEWVERIKGTAADNVSDAIQLPDGDLVLVGEVGRRDILPIDFFPGHPAAFTRQSDEVAASRYIMRLEVSNRLLPTSDTFGVKWFNFFASYGNLTNAHRLELGSNGELYCAGSQPGDFRTDSQGQPLASVYGSGSFMPLSNRPRGYVMRVEAVSGNLEWVGGLRHVSSGGRIDLDADSEGVFCIANGGFTTTLFDVNSALDPSLDTAIGGSGRFKYSASGELLWARTDSAQHRAVADIGGGRAVSTGRYSGRALFDRGLPTEISIDFFARRSSRGFVFEFLAGPATSIGVLEDISRECDPGANGATVFFVVSVSGAPAGSTLEVVDDTGRVLKSETNPDGDVGVDGTLFPIGVTAVTARLVDASQQELAREEFLVTVEDTTAPSLIGCGPKSLECAGPETPLVPALLGISASDDCDPNPQVTIHPEYVPLGTTTVTVTARDQTGNASECLVAVTVIDTIAPTFAVAPSDIERECTGAAGHEITWEIVAEDVCGVPSLVCTDQNGRVVLSGDRFDVGVHAISCVATDPSGNAAQHTFTITVFDNTAPVLVAPDDISQPNDPGECSAVVVFEATATDQCDPNVAVAYDVGGVAIASGDVFPIGESIVRATAVDKSGNRAEVTFAILVFDGEAPQFSGNTSGQASLVTDCAGAALTPSASDLGLVVTDNCDEDVAVSLTPAILWPGTQTVVVTATDDAGNADSASLQVTVLKGPFDCDVLRPLDPNVDNRIRAGRVVPIKLRVTCDNNEVSEAIVTVDRIDVLSAAGTPVANEPVEDPGLSHDNGSVFRRAGNHYHFNLSTKGWGAASGLRHRVIVRIQRAGHVDTVCELFFVNR